MGFWILPPSEDYSQGAHPHNLNGDFSGSYSSFILTQKNHNKRRTMMEQFCVFALHPGPKEGFLTSGSTSQENCLIRVCIYGSQPIRRAISTDSHQSVLIAGLILLLALCICLKEQFRLPGSRPMLRLERFSFIYALKREDIKVFDGLQCNDVISHEIFYLGL